jgi:RsiW-degrading membrane proteinase PrsW (M82 family)
MFTEVFLPPLVGLLPVICFLAVLLFLDSYKLVRLPVVVGLVCCGVVVAGASYLIGAVALSRAGIGLIAYSRYMAPLVEELLKGLVIVAMIRAHRIGFLVDAAIAGFAVGTGFALLENVYFLRMAADAGTGTWIVRGFGTALMHGGATAIFAVLGLALLERMPRATWRAFGPGFVLAVLLHSVFNQLNHSPKAATLAVLLVLPPLLYAVFERSERALGAWLGRGFDADADMLALIHSGRLSDSPVGRYLHTLRRKFKGAVVADVLCYLRLYTELALRAKGMLMLRANGFEAGIDAESKAKFEEMRYLESSIGRTGLRALRPLLHMSHKELWQLYVLEAG